MNVRLSFLGAAEGVTGSRHLLEVGERRILFDCGLFQGRREWARKMNRDFPVEPASVDAVVLTHAHIDHSGAIPVLVRDGFRGEIVCTPATADLTRILLRDSGKIQEGDALHLNRRLTREAKLERKKVDPKDLVEPLYTLEDAEACDRVFSSLPYHEEREILPGIHVSFTDQGHIIGAAAALVRIERPEGELRVCFSGDRGRRGMPILRDPEPYPECDVLLTESTYGDRLHDNVGDMEKALEKIVRDAMKRGGRLLIPAFSVGRTQNILYHLSNLRSEGRLPRIDVFVDSPLSSKATEVYARHQDCFDEETLEILRRDENPLEFPGLYYTEDVEESMALNDREGTYIVISASGMCEGGRIIHHLKHSVERPRDTILLVGWMAPNTLGRKLVDREPRLRIFGREHELLANVVKMNGFSAHADRDDLMDSVAHLRGRVKTVFLVHGEREQSEPLKTRMIDAGFADVRIAELGSTVEIG